MACVNHPAVATGLVRCRRCGQAFCRSCVVALRGQYYCARCKQEQLRDIQSGTEAGVLELASIGSRFVALLVDSTVLLAVVFALTLVSVVAIGAMPNPETNEAAWSGFALLLVVAMIGFDIVYEGAMVSSRGQTLGKMALGIKVVTPEGRDVDGGQAWGRAVVKQILFNFCAPIDWLPALFTKDKTAMHDIALKTRVVRFRR